MKLRMSFVVTRPPRSVPELRRVEDGRLRSRTTGEKKVLPFVTGDLGGNRSPRVRGAELQTCRKSQEWVGAPMQPPIGEAGLGRARGRQNPGREPPVAADHGELRAHITVSPSWRGLRHCPDAG